ncbi:MAG TPA: glycosyltransferase family 39 protein, partial [Blastocatellia bacterium]|nr:glycosyltransferase family 39 protein [Blastocatellia bacterium]
MPSSAVEQTQIQSNAVRPHEPLVTNRKWLEPLALVLVSLAIFVGSAVAPPALLDDADSAHAEVAREMVESGDWVTLKMDGIRYYEKDPLMYWMVAASFKVLGPNEFAARLPIALSTTLSVLAVWALGSLMFGSRAGFYSGLVMATCVGPFLFTRIVIPDILLTALICWAIYFFIRGMASPHPRSPAYFGFYACCGLAFLTKSLIGMVFPASIVVVYLVATRQIGQIREARLLAGCALAAAIALPWSALAGIRNEHFLWFHYINEQVYRYLGKRFPMDYDTVPLAVFYGLHAVWLFPWTVFLPASLVYIPRKITHLAQDQKFTLLLIIWVLIIVAFFSLSTRQEYYTLPAIPALAILCGRVLFDLQQRHAIRNRLAESRLALASISAGLWLLALLGLSAFVASIVVLVRIRGIDLKGDISSALTRNPEYYALSLGHIFDLTPRSLAALRAPVLAAGLALFAGGVLCLVFAWRNRILWLALALSTMMGIVFYWTHESMKVFEPYLSSQALAARVLETFEPGDKIVINGEYESGSTLNFYTRQPVYMLGHRSSNLWYGSYLEGAPMRFFDDDSFREAWNG